MPQATNQRLVSQMAASPTGQGTVYNALLKARAINRERAAVVNSCEKHRLEKIQRSIDKDSHHAEWRANQTINRIKGSLTKLLAYQKVLKEDFPAKQLCSQPMSVNHQSKSKFHNSPVSMQRDSGLTQQPDPAGTSRQSTNSSSFDASNFHSHTINQVSTANKRSQFQDIDVETAVLVANQENAKNSSQNNLNDSGIQVSKVDSKMKRQENNLIRKDAFPNEQGHQYQEKERQLQGDIRHTTKRDANKVEPAQRVADIRRRLLPLREKVNEHRYSKGVSADGAIRGANRHLTGVNFIDKKQHAEHLMLPDNQNAPQRQINDKNSENEKTCAKAPRLRVLDTCEESQMKGPLTDAQRTWHEKRIRRKDTVTQRIFTRGFDMRTLAWEIDRKLVVMDSGYARQRERRQLVKESKEDIQRIVSRNQTAFNKSVMASSKQDAKNRTQAPGLPSMMADKGPTPVGHRNGSHGDAGENGCSEHEEGQVEQAPVIETVTMLNPLLHKIPLSY